MEEFKIRLKKEHEELCERIKKLDAYLSKRPKGACTDEEVDEWAMMVIQSNAMRIYRDALEERMKLHGIEHPARKPIYRH